jgi:hypothetical protein
MPFSSRRCRAVPALVSLGCAVVLFGGCGSRIPKDAHPIYPEMLSATLVDEKGTLSIVLRNCSQVELVVCDRNFYAPAEYLDVRKFPDTGRLPPEKVFAALPRFQRKEVTLSDFVPLGPGREHSLPLDLHCIRNGCSLGDTVLLSVFFKNVDPFLCSNVSVDKCDKATQDYCRMLHCIPSAALRYWYGEVHTPFRAVNLCVHAPPAAPARKSPEVVVRRSLTHPLKHKVF